MRLPYYKYVVKLLKLIYFIKSYASVTTNKYISMEYKLRVNTWNIPGNSLCTDLLMGAKIQMLFSSDETPQQPITCS